MPIKVGDKVPDFTFKVPTAEGPAERTSAEVFGGKKVVLFAVPGAFTPTCHLNHMPGFVAKADQIKAKGVDAIAVTAVNDVFVLGAWAKECGADGKITFLADGSAQFAATLGLELDATAFGLGVRSKRYAMIVEDGTVRWLAVEENPSQANASTADAVLAAL